MGEQSRNAILAKSLVVATALGIGGLVYFFYKNKTIKTRQPKEISRDLLVLILKDLNKENFNVLKLISHTARAISKQFGRALSIQEMKGILHRDGKDEFRIEKEILKSRKEVYEKYGVDPAEVDTALNITYSKDREIFTILKKSLAELQEAYKGNLVITLEEFPEFLTSTKVLEILIKSKKRLLTEAAKEIPSKRSSMSPEALLQNFMNNKNLSHTIKETIYKEEGLDFYDDNPEKIMISALAKYAAEVPKFQEKLKKLDVEAAEILMNIIRGYGDVSHDIDFIGRGLVEPEKYTTFD
jgi:hypothetical protein